MMDDNQLPSIKIGIIGGGLAGLALGNALSQYRHIEVHIYESRPEFSERGAAVGLGVNSRRALRRFLPDADETLRKAGGVMMNSTRIMMGAGPSSGELVFDLGDTDTDPTMVFHRASLLRELLAHLNPSSLHTDKKLVAIAERMITRSATEQQQQQQQHVVEATFADGSTTSFDAIVGADGIFGTVRDYVLGPVRNGDDNRGGGAVPAGFWDCRHVVPFERAAAVLGKEHFELDRQYGWVNDGALIMHDVLEDRSQVQCVISAIERHEPEYRKRPLTREILETTLSASATSPHTQGMIDLLLDQPSPQCYSQWEHRATPTYTSASGRVCVMGDAAHATTPWQGSGAGLAMEDAMILGKLIGTVASSDEIGAALQAYSDVRRPRCQRVIDSSRETGQILCGQHPAVGLDPAKMREILVSRWEHIHGQDHDEHEAHAQGRLAAILQGKGPKRP